MIRRVLVALVALTLVFGVGLASPVAAQEPASPAVLPDEVTPTTQAAPEVAGDVVTRPLPRTGSDVNGTAVFGGALTVLGVALALGARRRRNAYDGG